MRTLQTVVCVGGKISTVATPPFYTNSQRSGEKFSFLPERPAKEPKRGGGKSLRQAQFQNVKTCVLLSWLITVESKNDFILFSKCFQTALPYISCLQKLKVPVSVLGIWIDTNFSSIADPFPQDSWNLQCVVFHKSCWKTNKQTNDPKNIPPPHLSPLKRKRKLFSLLPFWPLLFKSVSWWQ